jgi:hypothetical protein
MWDKLKQDRFETLMLAQGIDVRGDRDVRPSSPFYFLSKKANDPWLPQFLGLRSHPAFPRIASRLPGLSGHRSSSSLSYPASSPLTRPSHRSSPSMASVVFARPFLPLKAVNSDVPIPSPWGPGPAHQLESSDCPTFAQDAEVARVHAPVPRRSNLFDSESAGGSPALAGMTESNGRGHRVPWEDFPDYVRCCAQLV